MRIAFLGGTETVAGWLYGIAVEGPFWLTATLLLIGALIGLARPPNTTKCRRLTGVSPHG